MHFAHQSYKIRIVSGGLNIEIPIVVVANPKLSSGHQYVDKHYKEEPKVILPLQYQPEYTKWLQDASINNSEVIWL